MSNFSYRQSHVARWIDKFNWHVAVISSIALSVSLRLLIPSYFAYGAMHDDELMLRMAHRLNDGVPNSWDQYAMLKEPGYSYLLAFCLRVGISPILVVHLMLVASAYWFFHSFRKIMDERVAAYCAIAISLNPGNFGIGGSRFYNVFFVTALIVAMCAGIAQVIYASYNHRGSLRRSMIGITSLSVIVATMSISRPDGALIALLTVGGLAIWNLFVRTEEWRTKIIFATLLVSLIASLLVGREIVEHVNARTYDVSLVNDLNQGNFSRMMGNLASVVPNENLNFVVLSQATIKAVEGHSPTFRQIAPFLGSRDGELWKSITCDVGGPCNEVAGGFMPFLLRDAIIASFEEVDAEDFQQITGRIADEIDSSCVSGVLNCGHSGIGVWLPPLERLNIALTSRELVKLLVTRTYSFSDTTKFVNYGDPNNASSNAGSTWTEIRNELWGLRTVSEYGTPVLLQAPIRVFLRLSSVILQILVAFGTVAFLFFIWKARENRQICRLGGCMLLSVVGISFLNSLMFANSFGRSADGGNLAYLLMVQPLAIGISAVGLEMYLVRKRHHKLQPVHQSEIQESNR
jgi:hypothetical protein